MNQNSRAFVYVFYRGHLLEKSENGDVLKICLTVKDCMI